MKTEVKTFIRFGLGVSIAVYFGLLFCEYLRPGFVSTAMNVHALLIVIGVLGLCEVWWGSSKDALSKRSWLLLAVLMLVGILFAFITWHVGEDFGIMRFWLSVSVACLPMFSYFGLRNK